MIAKYKNMKIKTLYKCEYWGLSDLVNIRDIIFNNNKKHYNFSKYFQSIDKFEFEDIYNNVNLSKHNYLLCFETGTGKLKEFATYQLSDKDKLFNSAFLHALGTR